MKQIVPSLIWVVSIIVWLILVLCTGVLHALRGLAVRLPGAPGRRKAAARQHEPQFPGCRGC